MGSPEEKNTSPTEITAQEEASNPKHTDSVTIRIPGILPIASLVGIGLVMAYGLLQNSKNSAQSLADMVAITQSQNAQNSPQKLEDIDSRLENIAENLGIIISKQSEREPSVDKIKSSKSSWLEADSGFTSPKPMPAVHTRYEDGKILTEIYEVEKSKTGKSKYIYKFSGDILSYCQDGYIIDVTRKFRTGESSTISRTPAFEDCSDGKLTKEDASRHTQQATSTPLTPLIQPTSPTGSR